MNDLTGHKIEVLGEDGEFLVSRLEGTGEAPPRLMVFPVLEQAAPASLAKLERALEIGKHLDVGWAARPVELAMFRGRLALVVEDPGGTPLDKLIGKPFRIPELLRLAIGMARALGCLRARELIHRDIRPSNMIVNLVSGGVWLTGFGLALRLPRHRQPPEPPETIAGTLAYMAPEQTGRMNRSVDSRSDLYSLGVVFYQLFVGELPFTAADPMEWIHRHIAKPPVAPSLRRSEIPEPISSIILKLLAKTPEERYQTAAGVEADLRRCLSALEANGRVEPFALGSVDVPDRLMIPEKLYGRERQVETLLSAFERIVAGGNPELVLVSGYSGIGKSAVVNELHKSLIPPRGLFASGKFDQYKRDIPYHTLAQAFRNLIRPLLSKGDEELERWRQALRGALDPNGALVVDLVPELIHIVGEQPPVPALPARDAEARFHLVLRRFIGVFARPEHPLALFLDDLQWLDAATLDLLESLVSRMEVKHLLLIGAYRDNEVTSTHPLKRRLESMRSAGLALNHVVLSPLGREDLGQLLADSLRCQLERAAPLARLIHEKTSGNPFFAIQFIEALASESLITFDYAAGRWSWDLRQIHAKGYTDNVVELMAGRLTRLPPEAQRALQQLACLGNSAEFTMLQMVHQGANVDVHEDLRKAVRAGLVFRAETSYRFLHDRVQEAAYSLIPMELRPQAHLRIGRLLAENTPPSGLDEAIFEIVNQLNHGLPLISSPEESERVAGLDLMAAQRAKDSAAYASALNYLRAGRSLLTEAHWNVNHDLLFAIECLTAECELLTADMAAAEKSLSMLTRRAKSLHDCAVVVRLQITLHTTLDRSEAAIEIFLDYLRRGGTDWSNHPTLEQVMCEYDRIWSTLGSRRIEDLAELPPLTDPDVRDMLDVLTEIVHPAMFYDENLSSLAVCRMVNLSLEHGNCDGSCFGYVWFAMFAGPRFNNYKDGFRFGQLGYDLVAKGRFPRYQARTYITFSTLLPWAKHAADARGLVRRAYDIACRTGDLTFSAYSWHVLITNGLTLGNDLKALQGEAEAGLAFAMKQGFGLVVANCGAQLGLIRTLRGLTRTFGCFDDEGYSETESEGHLAANPGLALAEFFYWTRKLQARFFAGDYPAAVDASLRAQLLLWPAASQVETGDFRFYGALAHAAAWNAASAQQRPRHLDSLTDHHRQLKVWADHCPENFGNRAALVGAEMARIEGRMLEAEHLYEQAIHSSRANGFIHNEAVAHELAAQFYGARGLSTIAEAFLRNARACYDQWGALEKAKQIESRFPNLKASSNPHALVSTIGTQIAQFDADTVIKASQALSSEMNLPTLIGKLLRLALEHAGAQRVMLILLQEEGPRVEAEALSVDGGVEVVTRNDPVQPSDLPQSALQYALRTRERVLLDDASAPTGLSEDGYIREYRPRSLLCLPVLKQSRVIGAMYLENRLAAHAFTPGRVAVLEVLASQAAISLENARLYGELKERESRVRRLFNANIMGIFTWNLDGRILEANEAFLKTIGYGIGDLESGRMCWKDLMPPEWDPADDNIMRELLATNVAPPFEAAYIRKDGSRVPVLVGAALFEGAPTEGVAFVLDLSDRKRAEAELAHSNRLATMGQLTASIAHEVNQPLTGVVNNANACLGLLEEFGPGFLEVRSALTDIIEDADRASAVIARVRRLVSKAPPSRSLIDVGELVADVLILIRHESLARGTPIMAECAGTPAPVSGDRVQLQQVLLNLIVNGLDAMNATAESKRALTVRVRREIRDAEPVITVEVHDVGTGFDPEERERLFEAFYTTKPQGLGMGLAISRSIIEAHGGRLWAEPNKGAGATFQFCLPVAGDVPL